MAKITSKQTIVDMTGDEMAEIAWQRIRAQVLRFVDIKIESYDLSLENRFKTVGKVVDDAVAATKKSGVAVKCAGITPNPEQVAAMLKTFNLKDADVPAHVKKSPNGKLRKGIDCHLMLRGDIGLPGVKSLIPGLTGNPLDVARHGQGDDYEAFDAVAESAGKVKMVFTGSDGKEKILHERDTGKGDPLLFMKNNVSSIERFAHSCFAFALTKKIPVVLGTKNTILQHYDNVFKDIFDRTFKKEFEAKFADIGLKGAAAYNHQLIDALAAKILSSKGNMLLAVKNFMGDVLSDQIAEVYGSLATASSVLMGSNNIMIFEAPHGTAPDLYKAFKEKGEANFNPIASMYAWSGALRHAGHVEGNKPLIAFADHYEKAIKAVVGEGKVTGDLTGRMESGVKVQKVDLDGFLNAVEAKL